MRTLSFAAAAAAIAVSSFVTFAPAQQAEAMVIYPWCAYYGGRNGGGAPSCGFTTYAQCMATVSGMQGFCDKNPWWVDPPPRAASARRSRG